MPEPRPRVGAPVPKSVGTNQIPTYICKLDQAFTLGEAAGIIINVGIIGPDHAAPRVRTGATCILPVSGTRRLVVRHTLHNPARREPSYQRGAFLRRDDGLAECGDAGCLHRDGGPRDHGPADDARPGNRMLERPGRARGRTHQDAILEDVAEVGSPDARCRLAGSSRSIWAPYDDLSDATGTTSLKVLAVPTGQANEIAAQDVAALNVEQVERSGASREP